MTWEEFKRKMKEDNPKGDLGEGWFFAFTGILYLIAWALVIRNDPDIELSISLAAITLLMVGLCSILISYHCYNRYRLNRIISMVDNMQHHLETLGNQTAEPVKGSGRCEDSAEWEDLYQRNPPN